ncbi:MAG: GNAT family N-acetyltransferase [Planctomycetaceae bacterium]|nr:GNAT family N-acetyltransferase [Planctomycetaceae bacterium]
MSHSSSLQIRNATDAEFSQLLPVLLAQLTDDERDQKRDFLLNAPPKSMAPWCREPHATQQNFRGGLWVAQSTDSPGPSSAAGPRTATGPLALIWAHPAPGKTVLLGRPQSLSWSRESCEAQADPPHLEIQFELVRQATQWASAIDCEMLQAVAEADDQAFQSALERHSIRKLVDLIYLSSPILEPSAVARSPGSKLQLEVLPPRPENLKRWYSVIESTYLDSRDCPALQGHRSMPSVVSGYRATGTEWENGWVILRPPDSPIPVILPSPSNKLNPDQTNDLGCFILADHPAHDFVELVYFGLVPAARGQGLGVQILAEIEASAKRLGRSRIIAAVDRKNLPALRVYAAANYVVLEERSVFARFFTV